MKRTLLCAFVALQALDVMTTNHVLAHVGVAEANPVMALAQTDLGSWWWLPKIAVMIGCTLVMSRWPLRYVVPVVALMSAVVVNNAML